MAIVDWAAPPGAVQRLDQQRLLGHLTVRVVALCGPGEFGVFQRSLRFIGAVGSGLVGDFQQQSFGQRRSSGHTQEFRRKCPTLVVELSGWRTSSELRVRTRGDDGRQQPVFFRGSGEYLWTSICPG